MMAILPMKLSESLGKLCAVGKGRVVKLSQAIDEDIQRKSTERRLMKL